MFKWFSTLIFTNFILNCNSVTLWNLQTTEQHAEENLASISYKEALPLVLLLVTDETGEINLDIPEDMIKAELVNGEMVNGTQFALRDLQTQIFFCREPNSEEECLAPQNFKDSERLQCSENAVSTAKVMWDEGPNVTCGFSKTGFSFKVYYPICASNEYKYKARAFGTYAFCYDHENKKTLFTSHFILSPKLLNSKLLLREQQLKYPYEPQIRGFVPPNIADIINTRDSASSSSITPLIVRPKYGLQRLVPKEDMALGIWQKTTNQLFNFELQHNDLIPIWDEISLKVRQYAVEHSDMNLHITTAVIDNKIGVPASDVQIYNRWVKMVLAMSQNLKLIFGGVVFFMNNFRYVEGEFDYQPHVFRSLEQEMQQYCQIDICIYAFQERGVQGMVRCCTVTPNVAQLFGQSIGEPVAALRIQGLTRYPRT